jgi:hypothetical protein
LPDHTSAPRRLSEIQGDDPLILTLARGHDLWHDLRAVTREIRPDCDLGAPGLREAWEAGDLSAFDGWNRWSPERVAAARSAS